MDLENIKLELKGHIINNLIAALKKIEELINPQSSKFNFIIQFQARIKQISDAEILGTISHQNRNLELNKLRFSVIQFIDKIEAADLKENKTKDYRLQYLMQLSELEEEEMLRYIKYTKYLNQLPSNQRRQNQIRQNQIRLTSTRLEQLNLSVVKLKEALKKLGYYKADIISDFVDDDLIEAVTLFQASENIIPVDGIYGKVTHSYLVKMIRK